MEVARLMGAICEFWQGFLSLMMRVNLKACLDIFVLISHANPFHEIREILTTIDEAFEHIFEFMSFHNQLWFTSHSWYISKVISLGLGFIDVHKLS